MSHSGKEFTSKGVRNQNDVQIEQIIADAMKEDSVYLSLLHFAVPLEMGTALVYDYNAGGDLFEKMSDMKGRGDSFSERQLQTMMAQLIVGLEKLHRAGFAHCNIKLPNIMIDSDGHITIID